MGYTFKVGNAIPKFSKDDFPYLSAGWKVEPATSEDAPTFLGDEMTGNGNDRSPSYSVWHDFCKQVGIFDLFYDERGHMLSGHPGCFGIDAEFAERVHAARLARAEGYDAGRLDGLTEGAANERARIRAGIEALFGERPVAMQVVQPSTDQNPIKKPAAKIAAPIEPQAIPTFHGHLPKSAEKMLAVLDTNPPVRMSWNAVAASIGNKARGGHFNATRKALVTGGHVIEEGGLVRIAKPSQDAPAAISGAARAETLRHAWKGILGGRSAQIIDVLTQGPRSKGDVAAMLGVAAHGGHWNAAWKALRDNDLITPDGGDLWALNQELRA